MAATILTHVLDARQKKELSERKILILLPRNHPLEPRFGPQHGASSLTATGASSSAQPVLRHMFNQQPVFGFTYAPPAIVHTGSKGPHAHPAFGASQVRHSGHVPLQAIPERSQISDIQNVPPGLYARPQPLAGRLVQTHAQFAGKKYCNNLLLALPHTMRPRLLAL